MQQPMTPDKQKRPRVNFCPYMPHFLAKNILVSLPSRTSAPYKCTMHCSRFPGTQCSNILIDIPSEDPDEADEIAGILLGGGASCSRTFSTTCSTNASISAPDICCSAPPSLLLLPSRSRWSCSWHSSSIMASARTIKFELSKYQQLKNKILEPTYLAHSCLLLQNCFYNRVAMLLLGGAELRMRLSPDPAPTHHAPIDPAPYLRLEC